MAVLDNLIESLNANNFFVPVSICVVVGAVLLFTVIKWLSKSEKRDKAASFDVDDWDKETNGSLKKTKQKNAKATNSQAESGSNSARSKIIGKQSATAKVAVPATKEKQADVKSKALGKKQAASPVSSKSVQEKTEVQGEWMVAVSKKKQKGKKTEADVPESKTKTETKTESKTKNPADRQKNEFEVAETHKSVAALKYIEQPHEEAALVSRDQGVASVAREPVYEAVSGTSSEAEVVVSQPSRLIYEKPQVKNRNEEPMAEESVAEAARVDEGNVESDAVDKETKSKKSSKKKKSKAVSEPTQSTDPTVQKTTVTRGPQDDSGQVMPNIPSSSVKKPKPVETARKFDSERGKAGSKAVAAEGATVVGPDASKDVVKVAAKSVAKVSSKVVLDALKEVIPDSSKVVSNDASKVVANDASKGVVNDASKGAVNDASKVVANDASKGAVNDASKKTVPDAKVDGPASSQLVVFDELGLKESSADVDQPVLKKKKKARKDI